MPIRWTKRQVRSSAPNCWTPEEVERLKALLFARVPICAIAAEIGRTEGAVRTRAQQLGISLRALKA